MSDQKVIFSAEVRGHYVEYDGSEWRYEDGNLCDDSRACNKCEVMHEKDGPDPCLGWLPGVDYACCGHGDQRFEYVKAGEKRWDSVEAWRLDTGCDTLSTTTDQQEV